MLWTLVLNDRSFTFAAPLMYRGSLSSLHVQDRIEGI